MKEPCSEASVADFQRRRAMDNKGGGADSFASVRADLCRSRDSYYSKDFMRNKRDAWIINTKPYKGAHFAVFPEKLAEQCVLAACPEGGTVLDPFSGSGTTALVAERHKRNAVLIDINPDYIRLAQTRINTTKETNALKVQTENHK